MRAHLRATPLDQHREPDLNNVLKAAKPLLPIWPINGRPKTRH